jgi:alkylated DNA nucleotide flippase Atl1
VREKPDVVFRRSGEPFRVAPKVAGEPLAGRHLPVEDAVLGGQRRDQDQGKQESHCGCGRAGAPVRFVGLARRRNLRYGSIMRTRKTWREKMNNPDLPKIVDIPPRLENRFGKGMLLLPAPVDVEDEIRAIRKGTVRTVGQIRRDLASRYGTTTACPLMTGIFVRISAEAAEEDARAGQKRIAPYWRVVKDDGSLYPKFPGGVEQQAARLREEGVAVVKGRVASHSR